MRLTTSTGWILGATLSVGATLGASATYLAVSDGDDTSEARSRTALVDPWEADLEAMEKREAASVPIESAVDGESVVLDVSLEGEARPDEESGSSLAERLAELEAKYQDLVARQLELIEADEADEPAVAPDDEPAAEASPAVAALSGQDEDTYLESVNRLRDEPRFSNGVEFDASPDAASAPIALTQNTTINVTHITPVYVLPRAEKTKEKEEKRKKQRISTYQDLGLQRPVLQPSERHNPWAVTRTP